MNPLTEQEVEELADVFVRLESVVNVGFQLGVDVSEVQLSVEGQEQLVCHANQPLISDDPTSTIKRRDPPPPTSPATTSPSGHSSLE
jgi:hypothetical protein